MMSLLERFNHALSGGTMFEQPIAGNIWNHKSFEAITVDFKVRLINTLNITLNFYNDEPWSLTRKLVWLLCVGVSRMSRLLVSDVYTALWRRSAAPSAHNDTFFLFHFSTTNPYWRRQLVTSRPTSRDTSSAAAKSMRLMLMRCPAAASTRHGLEVVPHLMLSAAESDDADDWLLMYCSSLVACILHVLPSCTTVLIML